MMHATDGFTPVPQRWARPLDVAPGFWKQQLAGKYLALARRGDLPALRQLLAEHPEFLNKRGSHDRTLLWEATRRGKLVVVQWLVAQGADLDATGCYNGESHVQLTPYCAAMYYRRPDVATYLHDHSPQPDIFRAAFLGDQARVAADLAADATLLQAEDPRDWIYFMPLLAFPIMGGQTAMLEFLLKRGAPVAAYTSRLIGLAARAGRRDLLDLLIDYGADVRAVDSSIFGTVTDLSILHDLLRRGASATQPSLNGFPPLIYVARGDKAESPEKVQLLLEHGAAVNAIGPQGRTALHYAAAAEHLRVMTLLLDHGANLTLSDEHGDTPLSLARAAGKHVAAQLLIERGAHESWLSPSPITESQCCNLWPRKLINPCPGLPLVL